MAKNVRLVFEPKFGEELDKLPAGLALVKEKVEAIAEACNSQSSWGGYFSSASVQNDRVRGTVWSADNRNDEARDNRLLKNLDA